MGEEVRPGSAFVLCASTCVESAGTPVAAMVVSSGSHGISGSGRELVILVSIVKFRRCPLPDSLVGLGPKGLCGAAVFAPADAAGVCGTLPSVAALRPPQTISCFSWAPELEADEGGVFPSQAVDGFTGEKGVEIDTAVEGMLLVAEIP